MPRIAIKACLAVQVGRLYKRRIAKRRSEPQTIISTACLTVLRR